MEVEVARSSAAAISKVALSNGHYCILKNILVSVVSVLVVFE